MHAFPEVGRLAELRGSYKLKPLLDALLDLEQEQIEVQRMIALDAASVLAPKMNRYFTTATFLTLGDDKEVADAVRDLTPKVTAITEAVAAHKGEFERLTSELQSAMEDFRAIADERLDNVRKV
jgi:hypothetical protein